MNWLDKLFDKWTCKHEWNVAAKTSYAYSPDRYLLVCKKCGKIKRVRV